MDKLPNVSVSSVAAIGAALPSLASFYRDAVAMQAKREQELVFFSELAGKKKEELLADFKAFPGSWEQFLACLVRGGSLLE